MQFGAFVLVYCICEAVSTVLSARFRRGAGICRYFMYGVVYFLREFAQHLPNQHVVFGENKDESPPQQPS